MSESETNNTGEMTANELRSQFSSAKEKTTVREFAPGVKIKVRRVDLATYLACGLLPEHFHKVMLGSSAERLSEQDIYQRLSQMSAEEKHAMTLLRPRFVMAAVVSPRIVPGPAQDDSEISLLEIPDETQQDIFEWVCSGCPGIPIKAGGGEVQIDDLTHFREVRQKRPGGQPFSLEPSGAEIRPEAEPIAGVG